MGEGFSAGGLVAEGAGGGGVLGDDAARRFRQCRRFAITVAVAVRIAVFALRSHSPPELTSSIASGETAALAFGLAFTFAGGVIVPPDGIPSSPLPVGGCAGCTGWLFGSAASVCVLLVRIRVARRRRFLVNT